MTVATPHVIIAFQRIRGQIESITESLEAVPADALGVEACTRYAADSTASLFAESTRGGDVASECCSVVVLFNTFHLDSPAIGLPLPFQCAISDCKDELYCRTSSLCWSPGISEFFRHLSKFSTTTIKKSN